MRSGKTLHVRGEALAVLALFACAHALGAGLQALDGKDGVALRNAKLEVAFSRQRNLAPGSIRLTSGDGRNLLDLLIVNYLTGESKWWFQDNKRGKEGYRRFTYEISEQPDEIRLTISHPSDKADDPHFSYTKTIVLGRSSPFVELDYDFTCVREGELKSNIGIPSIWFAEGMTHSAFVGRRRTLLVGPQRELPERDIAGRWYAAFDPATNVGLLVAFVSGSGLKIRSGWSRNLNYVAASAPLRSVGALRKGGRVRSKFVLRPFQAKDVSKELPAMAGEIMSHYGLPAPKLRRVKSVHGDPKFDIHDLTLWERYRHSVRHPAGTFKPADIANAKRNVKRFGWAGGYVKRIESGVRFLLDKDRDYFERMIPATTPCSVLFTMCPACEAYPVHGRYRWSSKDPDKIACSKCGTVYPNEKYPETLVHVTKWGGGQRLTAYGGKSWKFRQAHHFTSTFAGKIRAHKVKYMSDVARRAGLACALTGKVEYAEKVRGILFRFAEVYPNYLVHTGYNEFADMDPKVAAARIKNLPEDEVTFPPNKPNRKLYPGFWMAGRASGVGMEGVFLTRAAEAYDLTCAAKRADGTSVYTDAERKKIERDLLIEGTHLLLNDHAFNNKTASNRRAVGVVGMVVGDPMRVQFGLRGFRQMVDEWYLFDGSTSESSAYGFMTLNGIFPMGEALHGYSDPPGFTFHGKRIDNFNTYGDARYRAVFAAFYESLLPDLTYPVLADHQAGSGIGARWAEVMFDRYGGRDYLAILQRRLQGRVAERGDEYALFHRPADADVSTPVDFALRSVFFPALKVGYLRAGKSGHGPTLVLSASDWGGHHHLDGLNVVYHVNGQECLTDLGYLWDSPHKRNTVRSFAHNLVVVDEANQRGSGRRGSLHLFDDGGWAKVIEASSNAYGQCSEYRRTCVTIDDGAQGVYVVDVFRVRGGRVHDYVFHGPNESLTIAPASKPVDTKLYDLKDVRRLTSGRVSKLSWKMSHGLVFNAHLLGADGETAYVGTGWGQRSHRETPGATIPYVVRRRSGAKGTSTFAALFEAHAGGDTTIKNARLIPFPDAAVIKVERRGRTDYIITSPNAGRIRFAHAGQTVRCEARVAVLSFEDRALRCAYVLGGAQVSIDDFSLDTANPGCGGAVADGVNSGLDSYLVVKTADVPAGDYAGKWLIVDDGELTTGYPIERVERDGTTTRLFTKRAGKGFRIDAAEKWRIWHAVSMTR